MKSARQFLMDEIEQYADDLMKQPQFKDAGLVLHIERDLRGSNPRLNFTVKGGEESKVTKALRR